MGRDAKAGWYKDPEKHHERRYWTGERWTDHVADGVATLIDQRGPQPVRVDPPPDPPTTQAGAGHAPNPVGLGIVLLGALGTVIALFLPRVESRTFSGVIDNTLITDSWWLLGPAVAAAGLAYGIYRSTTREGRQIAWLFIVGALIAYGGFSELLDEEVRTLYPVGRDGEIVSTADGTVADPGVGLYLLCVSAGLVLLGGLLLAFNWTPYGSGAEVGARSQKKCPDCAETILSEAQVCRFCGYRFGTTSSS